ncbi:MAG: S8 family serine peptidase [Bdellovibrionaceae bacterium]|nr:S8 family serine peptidase [Pseudobdellovibrionaceae bacterium]
MEVRKPSGMLISALFTFSALLASCSKPSKLTVASEPLKDSRCAGANAVKSRAIVEWEDGRISFEEIDGVESFKNKFMAPQIHLIKRVQFDQIVKLHPTAMTTQPESNLDLPTNVLRDWGQRIIEMDKVVPDEKSPPSEKLMQQILDEDSPVIVGVVDSYVDAKHVQLKGQMVFNTNEIPENGKDDDNNGFVDDYFGGKFISVPAKSEKRHPHGTHVAGIIAADSSLGPIRGIAPKARIVPAQFINDDGEGTLSDSIQALDYVAMRGARIINASWGGPCPDSLGAAFKNLERQGILLVVAAGNDGRDLEASPTYPAAFDLSTQLTVGASTENDFMAGFSNSSFFSVHLAAPGVGIWSTIPGNQFVAMDGTSMAAPFVSGAAALLWGLRPSATALQIKAALMGSVDRTPQHEFRVMTQGRLNVYKAYQKLLTIIP